MRTIGGHLFVRNGCLYDYCFIQSIQSMCANLDQVSVVGIITEDDTINELLQLSQKYSHLRLMMLTDTVWNSIQGKEKLAYFQNMAAQQLDTEYIYLQQADEVATDESWSYIREAADEGVDGYLATRINLWQSTNLMLNVPQERKPCSTHVLRLAKKHNVSYGDGESLTTIEASADFINDINIFHYGFIRKKEVHVEKITQMQRDIFLVNPDAKLDGMKDFDGSKWFGPEDLVPINVNHPKIMKEWIRTRP